MNKKYNTYLTNKELTCWLYLEDGMIRVDGEDYENYVREMVTPGSSVVIYFDMKEGTIRYEINGKCYPIAAKEEFFKRGKYYLTVNLVNYADSVTIIQEQIKEEEKKDPVAEEDKSNLNEIAFYVGDSILRADKNIFSGHESALEVMFSERHSVETKNDLVHIDRDPVAF